MMALLKHTVFWIGVFHEYMFLFYFFIIIIKKKTDNEKIYF